MPYRFQLMAILLICLFVFYVRINAADSTVSPNSVSRIAPAQQAKVASDSQNQKQNEKAKKVAVIKVDNEVDAGLYHFLKRAIDEAKQNKPDYIVFEINTYGGELHSAFEIVDLLLSVRECSTFAFVEKKAISAGALISLACNRLVMGEGTTIGDCAPITQNQDGIVMLGEKIQSPLRAKFRNLAERNGYPSLLAQSMVTMDLGVIAAWPKNSKEESYAEAQYFSSSDWKSLTKEKQESYRKHQTLVREGELLTMTDQEAQKLGFSLGSYSSAESFIAKNSWKIVATYKTNWSESMVRTLGRFTPILMMIGFGCLYMEMKTPGFGIFGISGILLLLIVFGSKYLVGLANHTETVLLLLGALLFLVEVFLFPGTLFFALGGIVLMMVALGLSMQNFTIPDPSLPWQARELSRNMAMTFGMAALAIVIPIISAKWLLPYLPKRMAIIQSATLKEAKLDNQATRLVAGEIGQTLTMLRPLGKAKFKEEIFEVQAQHDFIDVGSTIVVQSIIGQKIIVKQSLIQEDLA